MMSRNWPRENKVEAKTHARRDFARDALQQNCSDRLIPGDESWGAGLGCRGSQPRRQGPQSSVFSAVRGSTPGRTRPVPRRLQLQSGGPALPAAPALLRGRPLPVALVTALPTWSSWAPGTLEKAAWSLAGSAVDPPPRLRPPPEGCRVSSRCLHPPLFFPNEQVRPSPDGLRGTDS